LKLILGHNQFIGISHISEDKSRDREKFFSKVENIYDVVEKASELGFTDMIIETHPRMIEFLRYYEDSRTFDMNFFLQIPYVQGYVQQMNENGLRGLIYDIVKRASLLTTIRVAWGASVNYLKKDYNALALSALRLEIAPFKGFEIKSLLLHNVITDLLISLDITEILHEFCDFTEDSLYLKPGLLTLNFPLLKRVLDERRITPSFVMTPINSVGFDMNPSKVAVETALKGYSGSIIAMNILGGGSIPIKESASYLKSFDNIEYAVIGASSENHLKESMSIIGNSSDQFDNNDQLRLH